MTAPDRPAIRGVLLGVLLGALLWCGVYLFCCAVVILAEAVR